MTSFSGLKLPHTNQNRCDSLMCDIGIYYLLLFKLLTRTKYKWENTFYLRLSSFWFHITEIKCNLTNINHLVKN